MENSEPLYDNIGISYNATRNADPYIVQRLYDLLNPQSGKIYLDIGCGTGNYTIELAKKGMNFTGVEPSEKMLMEAKLKCGKINWLIGTAEMIPATDESMDGCIAALTIHHWSDLRLSFKELYRVLKSKAKMVIFTALPQQMKGYWLNHYFPAIMARSIKNMPSLKEIIVPSKAAGFTAVSIESYEVKPDLKDLFLYSGKENPFLYLDPEVRQGISSFSAFSKNYEVDCGLRKLSNDLQNHVFESIKRKYDNKLGDYIFIVLQKNAR